MYENAKMLEKFDFDDLFCVSDFSLYLYQLF